MPTSRTAYADTRQWLIQTYGPFCAYCAKRTPAELLTLDHVTPRLGQSAFDRRDNLVLCCGRDNQRKRDMPLMRWLLEQPMRAVQLVRFGSHLSPMLVAMARDLAGPEGIALAERLSDPTYPYAD